MPEEPKGLDQLSVSDQVIYDYLDDMFREPDKALNSESESRQASSAEIISNQALSKKISTGI